MRKEDIYTAIGEIDDCLIEQSEKNHHINKKKIAGLCALAASALLAVGISIALQNDNHVETEQTAFSENETEAVQTEYDNSPINYKELKISKNKSKLDFSNVSGTASLDIVAFDESMLKDCDGIVEGEIVNMRINEYHYKEIFDKFGVSEIIDRCEYTVAYDILVDRVWYGECQTGQTLTIEENIWWEDELFSPTENHRCVIPYFCGNSEIFHTDEYFVEGDTTKESPYQSIYGFQPQIEATEDNCYIVPKTWTSFCNDRMRDIVFDDIDENNHWWYECFGLGLVPADDFESAMNHLINTYCK